MKRISESQQEEWIEHLEDGGLTREEARAWVAGMIHQNPRAAAEHAEMRVDEWEVHKRVALDKFRTAQMMHILMHGPPDMLENPQGEALEYLHYCLNPRNEHHESIIRAKRPWICHDEEEVNS